MAAPPAALAVPRDDVSDEPPPESRPESPPAPPKGGNHFWSPGYWRRVSGKWAWEPGRWEVEQPGRFWLAGRWIQRGQQWQWVAGRWKDELPECAPAPASNPAKMVTLPAASFTMGADAGAENERPAHKATVAAFSMDLTEVTVNAYAVCFAAGKCSAPEKGRFCTWAKCDRGNHPVNCVTHTQAAEYCQFVGKRLPTEVEWEYAARGTDGRVYPWGADKPVGPPCSGRWDEARVRWQAVRATSRPFA